MIKSGMEFARNSKNSAIKSGTVIGVVSDNAKAKIAQSQQEAAKKQALSSMMPQFKAGQNTIADSIADVGARIKGFGSANEEKKYAAENPNLYSAMGGAKYNPIPSKTPTVLTEEGMNVISEAQKADKAHHQMDKRQPLSERLSADLAATARKKQTKGERLTVAEFDALRRQDANVNLGIDDIKKISEKASREYDTAKYNETFGKGNGAVTDKTLANKNAWAQTYKSVRGTELINNAVNSTDFQSKSTADKSVKDNTYQFINDIDGFRNKSEMQYAAGTAAVTRYSDNIAGTAAAAFARNETKPAYMSSNYEHLTDEEIKVYNYYYNTKGAKAANEYLSYLKDELQARANNELTTKMKEIAKAPGGGVAASLLSVSSNIGATFESGINIIKYVATGEMEQSDYSLMTSALRQGVTDKVDLMIGDWDAFDFVYQTGMSGADSLLMGGLDKAGEVMLGLSAAASTANDVLQRGGTNSQAFLTGLLAGCAEAFFEHLSLGNLRVMKETSVNTWGDLAKNLIKAMGVNASEEAFTEIANLAVDYCINGGISQYSLLVQEYIASGETPESARKKAGEKLSAQVGEAAASGALMGFGFGVLGSGSSYLSDNTIYKTAARAIVENGAEDYIIDTALKLDKSSKAYSIANDMQSNGKLNNQKLGRLAYEIIAEVDSSSNTKILSAVNKRLFEINAEYGENALPSDEMSNISDIFKKSIYGEELSEPEQKKVTDNAATLRVFIELVNRDQAWSQSLDSELSSNRETANAVRSAINLPIEKVAQIAEQNPILQSTANSGIINNRGENYVNDEDGRGNKEGYGESQEGASYNIYSGTESESARSRRNAQEEFSRRKRKEAQAKGTAERLKILTSKSGKSVCAYISKGADDSEAYRAVEILKSRGYDVDYSDGIIEDLTDKGIKKHSKAVTTPDGKIIVSSNATGPAEQIADHEEVHATQNLDKDAFVEYQSAVYENIIFDSDAFLKEAQDLNEKHSIVEIKPEDKIEEKLLDVTVLPKILNEFLAYMRQCYNFDADMAREKYGDIFKNWDEVAKTIEKFNKAVGANTQADSNSEPASFMPENESGYFDDDTGDEMFPEDDFEFTEPSLKDITQEPSPEEIIAETISGEAKTTVQRHILDIAKKLDTDLKVEFVRDLSTNGKFLRKSNRLQIRADLPAAQMYVEIFKHEFMHRLETRKLYNSYLKYCFNKSVAFKQYAYASYEAATGTAYKGDNVINALVGLYYDSYTTDKSIPPAEREAFTFEDAKREVIADFFGDALFRGKQYRETVADALQKGAVVSIDDIDSGINALTELAEKDRGLFQKLKDIISEIISWLKGETRNRTLVQDLEYLEKRLERVYASADSKKALRKAQDDVKNDIGVLDNGNTYVIASRKVINGTTLNEQRRDITNFFKKLLKNKPSIDVPTIEGDVLTITMKDTEDKARDNYKSVKGVPVKMTDDEFRVKLNVEAHIDEIAETSISDKRSRTNDEKNHEFAVDGFTYRTAYFEDFDGQYYRVRFSVGHNGTIATVYNVGKIEGSVPSSAKLIAVVGSQALDDSLPNNSILENESTVNNNSTQNEANYTESDENGQNSLGSPMQQLRYNPHAKKKLSRWVK